MAAMRRVGCLLMAVTASIAGLSGCGGSSGRPAPAGTGGRASVDRISAAQLDAARTGALMVVDDYERSGAAVKEGTAKKADPGGIAQYFVDPGAEARFQGGGGIGAPIGCGAGKGRHVVDGAIVGTPVLSAAAPHTIAVPVSLYSGTEQVAQLAATTDAAGKLRDFSCAAAVAAPGIPGAPALTDYYGGVASAFGDPAAGSRIGRLKKQFLAPAFTTFARPDVESDESTCSEGGTMPYWHAVYAPSSTTTGAQWYFWSGGPQQVNMSVAVDGSGSHVAWVYCFGQLPPAPAPGSYAEDQLRAYVGDLFNNYAYLLALKPFGADPSGMAAYFTSTAAYRGAAASSGAQPLECSATAAGSISADRATISGGTAVVELTSAPSSHELSAGETALGHPKVTVDLTTLKLASVTCG